MGNSFSIVLVLIGLILIKPSKMQAQVSDDPPFYQEVITYTYPVLPGDHPDPTLLKVGDDFYHCGSTIHLAPFMPNYHSKDLAYWEVIGLVSQQLKTFKGISCHQNVFEKFPNSKEGAIKFKSIQFLKK